MLCFLLYSALRSRLIALYHGEEDLNDNVLIYYELKMHFVDGQNLLGEKKNSSEQDNNM